MLPSHVLTILFVSDLSACARFIDEVFCWPKSVDVPVYVEYDLDPRVRIGIMPQANTRHFLGQDLGSRTFRDECPRAEIYLSFDDVKPVLERLTAKGATCVSPLDERDWGDRVAYYRIFDGYILAVAETAT